MKNKSLIDAIKEFRDGIEDSDYANLGGKGKYLTVPYRLKFVREFFGERIRIITDSYDLPESIHKFKTEIYLDDKLVSTGLSKQTLKKDKEFEKQSTVSCGRALSFLGFFGDELATAEEMAQFLDKGKQQPQKPKLTIVNVDKSFADEWIDKMQQQGKNSTSPSQFEKGMQPLRSSYEQELQQIGKDLALQKKIDDAEIKIKQQITFRSE